jgi:competence protein ComEA
MLALLVVHWIRLSSWGTSPIEIERLESRGTDFRFDINSATWVEFRQLDGIGETLAHRIVEDREQNGPFQSIDDLRRVRGIGPKTLERIRPWLEITPKSNEPNPRARRKS